MSTNVEADLAIARKALSHYLSNTFGVNLYLPDSLGKEYDGDDESHSFGYFITLLPMVRQKSINDKNVDFSLPLVCKPIRLTPAVAIVINALLMDGNLTFFEVPIFFYPDGSTMVINFDPIALATAVSILSIHPEYIDFLRTEQRSA